MRAPRLSPDAPRAKALTPADGERHRAWLTPLTMRNAKREAGRRRTAEIVDRALRRMGVSDLELGEALELNPKHFASWRDASEGIQLGDLLALAEEGGHRQALAVLDAVATRIKNRIVHED